MHIDETSMVMFYRPFQSFKDTFDVTTLNDVYQRVVPPYENLRHVKVFNFSTRITFNFLYSNTHIRGLHVYHLAPKRRAADNDTIKSALLFDTYSSNVAGNAGTNFFAL